MSKNILAIANCRVSSDEQLLNNSLARQQKSVESAATRLDATIVRTWSGSVSSKAGTNVKRKDLLEMLDFCKKHKRVKFAIFDEYDRFMRSINEGPYFEVLFQQEGVKIWYASESDSFNGDDAMAKFQRTMSAYKAEGSNEERQRKSIAGQTAAILEGRYPFVPKLGYKKGRDRAVPEIHETRGPALRNILIDIASYRVTPSQGLVELNRSPFMTGRAPLKMDKFRKIATDPFYARVVVMDKQVKARNENGLHEPLITMEQHLELVKIMDSKKKNQKGPRKGGNPKYPLSNHVSCARCKDKSIGRFVGLDLNNGQNKTKIYEKYRCRSCKRYVSRQELHDGIIARFEALTFRDDNREILLNALQDVWSRNQDRQRQESVRLTHQLKALNDSIENQVEALADPKNSSITDEIRLVIDRKKESVALLETKLLRLNDDSEKDHNDFLRFAFDFIDNLGTNFFDISNENRLTCKQIIFPGGFWVDENKKVYTPEISPIYRLVTNKKDLPETEKSFMVRVKRL
jgi:DNA invertase Pin-like site-specific DNA recombinase